ncbi:hypothetical protein RGV33_05660 [Pseudomonas sp. Bout1]|uniref:hypothetical protein n=1 Tax=Pseudomonas sp. Bout1 TaxID=3048600 RepID=UPI002AB5CE8B|nr:hypothetical protein [Pseudomonas sp. Bout1]MDY7531162.1 hypothetical protein [Pseudomonas sp. Bout1]MEB0187307.1 hypothetical protein [Pseudomonas sp. Bout1]
MLEHNEQQATGDRIHADVARIYAEISRMNAEQTKLRAESMKITCETFWYPVAIATGFYAAVGTVIVVAQKLFA